MPLYDVIKDSIHKFHHSMQTLPGAVEVCLVKISATITRQDIIQ